MYKLKKILYVLMITIAMIFTYTSIVKANNVKITTETLFLRAEPTTESDIVALISIGEECKLLGEEEDWYQVQYGEHTGYISKEYAEVVGGETNDSNDISSNEGNNSENKDNYNDNNSANQNDSNSEIQDGNNASNNEQENNADKNTNSKENNSNNETNTTETTTTTDNQSEESTNTEINEFITATTNKEVKARIVPLINGSVIENLKSNTEVTVINQINDWAYIQTDTISAWVRADTLTIQENNSSNDNSNKDSDKNLNNDSSDNSSDNNENENNQDSSDKNTSENNASDFEEKTMYTNNSATNIRKEASTDAEILMVVDINTSLKVIGETGNWYQVETSQGNAYVSKELLSNKKVSVTNRGDIDRKTNEQESKDDTSTKNSKEDTNTSNNETSTSEKSNTSSSNSSKAKEIVSYAKKFLGVPYVYGGASPSGFDCSGFTMYVYNNFGISMRHGAQAQSKLGTAVNVDKSSKSSMLNNLEVGDLVFFLDYETMDEIGHCGLYIGDGNFIHASSGSGYCVKINSLLPGEYYNARYCAARRLL